MNGIGNAILVVDRRGQAALDGAAARRLNAREGFGFDQLMSIGDARGEGADASVEIFNTDGSSAGACGNGTRCVAWFLCEETGRSETTVETEAGLLAAWRDGPWAFTVDMGRPRLRWDEIPLRDAIADTRAFLLQPHAPWMDALGPCAAVSMGNPHAVFFPPGDPSAFDLAHLGPALEHHPMFPARANVSIAHIVARDTITLTVWERGAGLTRACGSAACASVVAGARLGLTARNAAVRLPGGVLDIRWREADDHVLMSGAVALEHAGELVA